MIDIQQARGDEAAQARAAGQADRAFDAALSNAAADLADTVEAAIDRGERTAGNFLASAAAWFEGVISGLGNLLASPSKPTELEREVAPKVAAERAQDNADLAAYFDNEAARDRLLGGIRIDDAEQERQSRLEGGRDPDYERDM